MQYEGVPNGSGDGTFKVIDYPMAKRLKPALAHFFTMIFLVALSACGTSVSDLGTVGSVGEPPAVIGTGIFRDSWVSGLTYISGSQSGVTDLNGTFKYEFGSSITFSIGNITLGTTNGNTFLTPLDFVLSGNTADTQVLNIARFLMLLDKNGSPNGGILITQEVQDLAKNRQWPQIDFKTTDLDAALASIVTDLQTVPGEHHVLPDAAFAKAHLDDTLRCAYSGGFSGSYIGQDTGNVAFYIDSITGYARGWANSSAAANGFTKVVLDTPNTDFPLRFDQPTLAVVKTDTADHVFEFGFSFSGIDQIDGGWSMTAGSTNLTGSLTGTRLDINQTATARFTGTYTNPDNSEYGIMSFGVTERTAEDIPIEGAIFSVPKNTSNVFTGSVINVNPPNNLQVQSADNTKCFIGDIDFSTRSMNGRWYTNCTTGGIPTGTPAGTFTGTGCQLN